MRSPCRDLWQKRLSKGNFASFRTSVSNGFKVVAGRKNIGHIGHVQRDRFLDTEALAEERKRGADTEE